MTSILSLNRPNVAAALSTSTSEKASVAGWTDVAIKAAEGFTISQRKKLQEMGAMDIKRPIQIKGETIDTAEKAMRNDDCKIIHFQRHGQGYHNLICDMWREMNIPIDFDSKDPAKNPVVRSEMLDPPLTESGRRQCRARRGETSKLNPQLIVVSPLLRTIQTAKISFSSHSVVPWVAHEGCREELGLLVGNKRRPLSDIREDYPEIDFSEIEHDEDVLWENYGDVRETLLEKSDRIFSFLDYIQNRPEKEIAVVGHSAWLFTCWNAVMDIEDEPLRKWPLTSEVRSMRVTFEKRK